MTARVSQKYGKHNAHSSEEFSGEWAVLYNGILYMSLATFSIHIVAIEGAYDAFIENWELTFREYPDLLTGPENWKQIEKYSDNLQRYLEFIRSKHLKMLESQRQGG